MGNDPTRVTRGDWLLGAVVGALVVVSALTGAGPKGPAGGWEPRALAVGVLVGGIVAVRRWLPLVTLVLANLAAVGWLAAGFPTRTIVLAPLVALFTVGSMRGLRSAAVGTALTAASTAVAIYGVFGATGFDDRFVNAGSIEVCAAALGVIVHQRRSERAALREAAERTVAARAEEVRRAAAEHQVEMARELHDVVGHTLAAVRVQSRAALHVIDRTPEQARAALQSIAEVSGSTITEIQGLLGRLRADGPSTGDDVTVRRLDTLVRTADRAGLGTRVQVSGDLDALPADVDRVAYRVVQESLTNVVRHAMARQVDITVAATPTAVRVRVADDGAGKGTSGNGSGTGIAGMRERAASVGGTLRAGPTAEGYVVEAHLPIREAAGD